MTRIFVIIIGILLALTLSAAWILPPEFFEPLAGCENNEELNVYCDFTNPEDLALTPDNTFLIVAEFGGMAPLTEMRPGKLSFFNTKEKTKDRANIFVGTREWGSSDCSRNINTPLGPHGLDLVQRQDGRFQLAVVSHYPTETIEMFELKENDGWILEWKGCVDVEGQYYFNDVSLDKSGNFYATHMFDTEFSFRRLIWNVFAKSKTGMVVKWNHGDNFEELEYTAGSFPNGIALDQENGYLIVNYNLGDQTVLFDLGSEKALGVYQHNSPDNVIIKDGFAWVTNHDHSISEPLKCRTNVNCPLPFSVNQLSLKDLSLVLSYKFKSKNMGVGTVGLPHNGSIWIGSYHSNRIAEARLSLGE